MINPRLPAGGRTKPPKGMAVIDRTNPVGNKVTACWLLNEGGGGRVTDLVSGISSPITLNATEANRAKWKGSPDGIPCLDFGTSLGNYAACTGLQPVSYTRGISFLGLFNYPTAGSSGANRCLVMTRSDGFNGLMMSYYSSTLTITTKGWGGWGTDTGLTPTRDRLIAVAGTQAPNGDVRIWLNNRRYSTTGTAWSVPTIREWYIGVDSYDMYRQWAGPVYMTAVLHGVLSWGEMEAWARAPFAFVTPRPSFRSLGIVSSAFTATAGLTIRRGTLASTANFTKPTYSGSGPVTIRRQTLAGVGTFTKPTYAGIGGLVVNGQTLAGVGAFTKPTYTGSSGLRIAPEVLYPSGTGIVIQPTYAATAGLTVKAETLASVASFSAPSYTGVGFFTIDGTELDGTASVTQPTYAGSGGLVVAATGLDGSATYTNPTFTGSASLRASPTVLSGTGDVDQPIYVGSTALSVIQAVLSGTGTTLQPTFGATSSLTLSATLLSGTSTVSNPIYSAEGSLGVRSLVLSGSSGFTGTYTGTGSLNVGAVFLDALASLITGPSVYQTYCLSAFSGKMLELLGIDAKVYSVISASGKVYQLVAVPGKVETLLAADGKVYPLSALHDECGDACD